MLSFRTAINRWIHGNFVELPLIEKSNSKDMLFREYFIKYLKSLDGGMRSRTYSSMINTATHIINGLGNYRMSELNKSVLKEFINGFTKKMYIRGKSGKPQYYSQSMIDKIYNLLHAVIKEASDGDGDRLLRTDFMANIKKPRTNHCKTEEPKSLTDEEMALISQIVSENKMISVWIHLMLYTGVRPSEGLALKFGDINYENKTVDIQRTLSYDDYIDTETFSRKRPRVPIITTLKNEREGNRINLQRRTLKVGDKILKLLKEWECYVKSNETLMQHKREHGTEDFIFSGPHGQFWLYDDYQQVYERLLKKHGLSISEYFPYRFRHNCCTRLFRLGINIKAAQLIMGDNTPDMVMRVYANLDRSDVLKGSQYYSDSLDMALGVVECENSG